MNINRNDVIVTLFPKMTLRRFKRTTLYKMLRIHEHRENRKAIFYERHKLNRVLKQAGYEHSF